MQDPRMALVEKKYHKAEGSIPEFRPGDTVKVHVKVVEGNRSRIQVFEGVVIGRQHGGLRENFVVRKISNGVGVERIFPVHCPSIDKIEVVRKGPRPPREALLPPQTQRKGSAYQRAQRLRITPRTLLKHKTSLPLWGRLVLCCFPKTPGYTWSSCFLVIFLARFNFINLMLLILLFYYQ